MTKSVCWPEIAKTLTSIGPYIKRRTLGTVSKAKQLEEEKHEKDNGPQQNVSLDRRWFLAPSRRQPIPWRLDFHRQQSSVSEKDSSRRYNCVNNWLTLLDWMMTAVV